MTFDEPKRESPNQRYDEQPAHGRKRETVLRLRKGQARHSSPQWNRLKTAASRFAVFGDFGKLAEACSRKSVNRYTAQAVAKTVQKSLILVVDDDRSMRDILVKGLTSEFVVVEAAANAQLALDRVATGDVDAVVTDLRMPGLSGLDLCERIVTRCGDIPVIVFTAFGDYETAVQALRVGAYDFLSKPVRLDVLSITIERALNHARLRREVRRLRDSHENVTLVGNLLGESPAIKVVLDLIERVAPLDSSVIITGESGTGKELVAHALHERSERKGGPFVAMNCAAVPEQLLESELFGHEKGSFTDARTAHVGLFVQANGGTLFLDEIGELPVALQPKLLRAIQERSVRPLGGRRELPFDVRLIAATNRDLVSAMSEGRFREDLYFRMNVIEIGLPPLRARGNDLLLLAQHFITTFASRTKREVVGMTPEAAGHMIHYDWPGNVRELANVMERAVALTNQDHISVADLPDRIARDTLSTPTVNDDPSQFVTLEEMEKRYVLQVLEFVGGSRTEAARILGLDRTTLWRRLERYGVVKLNSQPRNPPPQP
jgi:DNA-binding NtrC family response regulator